MIDVENSTISSHIEQKYRTWHVQ